MSVAQETIGPQSFSRRLPVGVEIVPEGGAHFRVWAPDRKKVKVLLEEEDQHSEREKKFIAAIKWGYLYQGQWYAWQKQPPGTPALDLPPWKFVNFLQNHDQLANSGSGKRAHLLTSPSRYRAITAVFLLAPQTPMLFQGQEFAASSPFFYFVDQKILLPKLLEIIDYHLRGTRFGIAVDPEDGLLRQGESGYALTWMDAKMGDWVVTPRRGKAVEITPFGITHCASSKDGYRMS